MIDRRRVEDKKRRKRLSPARVAPHATSTLFHRDPARAATCSAEALLACEKMRGSGPHLIHCTTDWSRYRGAGQWQSKHTRHMLSFNESVNDLRVCIVHLIRLTDDTALHLIALSQQQILFCHCDPPATRRGLLIALLSNALRHMSTTLKPVSRRHTPVRTLGSRHFSHSPMLPHTSP